MVNKYDALRVKGEINLELYESQVIEIIREQVGSDKVLLALSGGVDSSVCAALLEKAVPGKLQCVFVDHGFMRKNEGETIEKTFKGRNLELVCIDAKDRFLARLVGVTDPEKKRKIIGEEFIRVFEEHAKTLSGNYYLAQGTIYADVVESGTDGVVKIKSHHNVGGLPSTMDFKGLVEPLRALKKPEVRILGWHLGLPAALTERQPFPGPGLAVRCLGEVTNDKLDVLKEADAIFCEEIENSDIRPSQYFAALMDTHSVGIVNDARSYGNVVALRAVKSTDFMTAEYVQLPYDLLSRVSERITSEIPGITRVVYDISNKPPSTVEWE
ncbi:MAG: glutamine-hydrolyzing GMP synthase [Oscillospiraceae bacterium]|nr:glutamine-hydrolyzing GMP synthase [Oscillospiraceae bacterium]